ncbi:MAG TPA: carbohydrate kinase family protein [Acidimicrobiales bacterium]|nr:carbohydrate kinase family protein [Acidimicrobiales bacterium]
MTHHGDRWRFDVLCVGDVASDLYVPLPEDRVRIRSDGEGQWLELPFGGKVPFDRPTIVEAGGNAANAAVACARLGLRTALASFLGADHLGLEILAAMHAEGIDTSLVRLDMHAPTNRHFVLWVGHERTILVRHEDYDYRWARLGPSELPAWLYLTSVGRNADAYQDEIADWLDEYPSVDFAFEPGTHQIERGVLGLERLYRRASLLVCNFEEAATICGLDPASDADTLLSGLLDLGPRRIVITNSVSGAYATDGATRYEVPIYPDAEPIVDRTGAGDAFAATLVAFLAQGMSLEEGLLRAPVNSMSVVHGIGPQARLLRPDQLDALLHPVPVGFAVRSTLRTPEVSAPVTARSFEARQGRGGR